LTFQTEQILHSGCPLSSPVQMRVLGVVRK
jgi:hypothetical protein